QRQGKLAYLTVSNPTLIDHLQRTVGITDPVELVAKDLFKPQAWTDQLRALSSGDDDRLAQLVPSGYHGANTAERVAAYSDDLARKIRLSYPNHVVQRTLETDAGDELRLGAARGVTATLLKNAMAKDFKLGQTSVSAFLKSNPEVLAAMSPAEAS